MVKDTQLAGQILELRRGVLVLVVLSQLRQPRYGYGLLRCLEDGGIAVDAGTLYPLLRRLERQDILTSHWNTQETRPRKYYQLSQAGVRLYENLLAEWRRMTTNINQMTQEKA